MVLSGEKMISVRGFTCRSEKRAEFSRSSALRSPAAPPPASQPPVPRTPPQPQPQPPQPLLTRPSPAPKSPNPVSGSEGSAQTRDPADLQALNETLLSFCDCLVEGLVLGRDWEWQAKWWTYSKRGLSSGCLDWQSSGSGLEWCTMQPWWKFVDRSMHR